MIQDVGPALFIWDRKSFSKNIGSLRPIVAISDRHRDVDERRSAIALWLPVSGEQTESDTVTKQLIVDSREHTFTRSRVFIFMSSHLRRLRLIQLTNQFLDRLPFCWLAFCCLFLDARFQSSARKVDVTLVPVSACNTHCVRLHVRQLAIISISNFLSLL